ncbi:MAG: hypothetical protein AAF728_00750 [Cyanobacteria bacterium P01_D01_bin.128]
MSVLRFLPAAAVGASGVASGFGLLPPAMAQSCPHATIRVESTQTVDQAALCSAAQPWAAEGYEVLIFLTDVQPASEDAWYNLLDSIEAEAGLRDLTQTDSFNTDAIAFAATTAPVSYNVAITVGESFYDTPLDILTPDTQFERVEGAIVRGLDNNNPTQGFVSALETAWTLIDGELPATTPPTTSGSELDSSALNNRGGGWRALVGGGLILVGGGAGVISYRRKRLQKQLASLQGKAANLMMICEDHLSGSQPELMIPYQRFATVGGEVYPDMTRQIKAWLITCRSALDEAFTLSGTLQEDKSLSLEKQLEAWENLYLVLVGSRDRILNRSEAELQTLLKPSLTVAETQIAQPELSQKLAQVSQKLAGNPIKADFKQIKPSEQDIEGILGYLEQIERVIEQLRKSPDKAREALIQLNQQRQAIAADFPGAELNLTSNQVLTEADKLLKAAEVAAAEEKFLDTLSIGDRLTEFFTTLQQFNRVYQTYQQHQTQIQTWHDTGYRPPLLPAAQRQTVSTIDRLKVNLAEGKYGIAADNIQHFEVASQNAFGIAEQWQRRHQNNAQRLKELRESQRELQRQLERTVAPAWQTLQTYPDSNWRDINQALSNANTDLTVVGNHDLAKLAQLNSLDPDASLLPTPDPYVQPDSNRPIPQDFDGFDTEAEAVGKKLHNVQGHLSAITDRLSEIQAAEKSLPQDFADTTEAIAQVDAACAKKVLGLIRVGNPDARLETARQQLTDAQAKLNQREIIVALDGRDQARRSLLLAYSDELRSRSAKVSSVVDNYKARDAGRSDLTSAKRKIKTTPEIQQASRDLLWQMYQQTCKAEQLLVTAERTAKRAIRHYQNASSSRSSYHHRSSYSSSVGFGSRSNTGFGSSSSSSRRSSSKSRSFSSRKSSRSGSVGLSRASSSSRSSSSRRSSSARRSSSSRSSSRRSSSRGSSRRR